MSIVSSRGSSLRYLQSRATSPSKWRRARRAQWEKLVKISQLGSGIEPRPTQRPSHRSPAAWTTARQTHEVENGIGNRLHGKHHGMGRPATVRSVCRLCWKLQPLGEYSNRPPTPEAAAINPVWNKSKSQSFIPLTREPELGRCAIFYLFFKFSMAVQNSAGTRGARVQFELFTKRGMGKQPLTCHSNRAHWDQLIVEVWPLSIS